MSAPDAVGGETLAELLAELEFAPSLHRVADDVFEISRDDIRRLLQARTKAAAALRSGGAPPDEPVAICCIERWEPGMGIHVEPGCAACELEIEQLQAARRPSPERPDVDALNEAIEFRDWETVSALTEAASASDNNGDVGEALKPCPFCGGEAELWSGEDTWLERRLGYVPWVGVSCSKCDAMGESFKEYEPAIAAWNRRSHLSQERPV